MEKRISVLGVEFDNLTPDEAVICAERCIKARSAAYVMTPNPEIVWSCRTNNELKAAVSGAELVLADGIGIIYGAKIQKTPLKGRVTGIGFGEALLSKLAETGGSVFLLGAKPGVAETAGEKLAERFPGLVIAGTHDGYFDDDAAVVAEINAAKPDFLVAGLGPPKDLWISKNHMRLDIGLAACLGGSLDVWAGAVKRAPVWMQKCGLEWLYRLIKQPSRIGRMMSLPKFLFAVILSRGKFES